MRDTRESCPQATSIAPLSWPVIVIRSILPRTISPSLTASGRDSRFR
ncbi:hypothetical protein [Lichenifustis flavocetrariae]|uniref:Uncharacterized protein n=1 Tax=Lichenifustis flavocetrariae TaxID=2949735 RepID=A0AA41Z5C6_9HYPH|nr:hypothetical protein [Lichenifustis flavocetrariae]MCW6510600.1 hypothetical protein [Lichenifustis flavocetrariae]